MKSPITSIIVAMSTNRGIGKNNDLMWHLPEDMKFFKEKTFGHPVIMGRKNYESIPEKFRPFKNRLNIVISRQDNFSTPGCVLVQDLIGAIEVAQQDEHEEIFVIGGGQVYRESLQLGKVDRMYITQVEAVFDDAEVFFPEFDESLWQRKELFKKEKDEKHQYGFVVYEYNKII
jgi:dihydrofolate reductase